MKTGLPGKRRRLTERSARQSALSLSLSKLSVLFSISLTSQNLKLMASREEVCNSTSTILCDRLLMERERKVREWVVRPWNALFQFKIQQTFLFLFNAFYSNNFFAYSCTLPNLPPKTSFFCATDCVTHRESWKKWT